MQNKIVSQYELSRSVAKALEPAKDLHCAPTITNVNKIQATFIKYVASCFKKGGDISVDIPLLGSFIHHGSREPGLRVEFVPSTTLANECAGLPHNPRYIGAHYDQKNVSLSKLGDSAGLT